MVDQEMCSLPWFQAPICAESLLLNIVLLFLFNTGCVPGFVNGVIVLDKINGKQYILSDVQLAYRDVPAGCTVMNASPAFLDTNEDFLALRKQLSLNESLKNASIWVNITQRIDGSYFWAKEEVSVSLWWAEEPNKQGAGEDIDECRYVSDTCRPVTMNRVRSPYASTTHDLMDTCCLYSRYFFCEDIDECLSSNPCPDMSQCTNTAGSYQCTCSEGYEITSDEECHDIDECQNHRSCSEGNQCINTAGSYQCVCSRGYELTMSGQCQDIDECSNVSTFTCSPHSHCKNIKGNYTCTCDNGFQMSKTSCVDIDECSNSSWSCPSNSYCVNTYGSFYCACEKGYHWSSNKTCTDVDECSNVSTFTCSPHSHCKNIKGNYTCICDDGFQMSNKTCLDIDECSLSMLTCSNGSLCCNTPGSYTCMCTNGFVMNNTFCQDIDECSNSSWSCPSNSYCVNTDGSFHCACEKGYHWTSNKTCSNFSRTTKKCPCMCDWHLPSSPSDESIAIWSDLLLKINTLPSYLRARECAEDWQIFNVATGCGAVIFLVCLLSFIAVMDVIGCIRYVNTRCYKSDSESQYMITHGTGQTQ